MGLILYVRGLWRQWRSLARSLRRKYDQREEKTEQEMADTRER
jgi:hypothetical protein